MNRNRTRLILSILIPTLVIDQLTKEWAKASLKGWPGHSYLGDFFRLQYAENPGAFLSLGSGLSDSTRFWVLTVAVALFLGASLVYLWRSQSLTRVGVIGLALVSSGGVSNLIDRLFRPEGKVIDFLNVGVNFIGGPGGLRTGIFNVADMAIVAGIILLSFSAFEPPPALTPAEHSKGVPTA